MLPDSIKETKPWKWLLEYGLLQGNKKSSSEEQIAQLLQVYLHRKSSSMAMPLLIDDGLHGVDDYWRKFATELILDLSRTTQVVLFSGYPFDLGVVNTIVLKQQPEERLNAVFSRVRYIPERLAEISPCLPKYVRGEQYLFTESKVCELKEVKGSQPIDSIKSLVDQYVVAFLNAGVRQKGIIIWGVRDEDRAIQGVKLTESQCDELARVVTEKLMQITPAIAPSSYKMAFHKISDGSAIIKDLYLIEILVPSVNGKLLYATGREDVYVKTDAGKKKLTAIELQMEVLRRHGLDDKALV
jgi:hypothetical protein